MNAKKVVVYLLCIVMLLSAFACTKPAAETPPAAEAPAAKPADAAEAPADGAAAPAAEEPVETVKYRKHVTIANPRALPTLDPLTTVSTPFLFVYNMTHETLIGYNYSTGELEPQLATDWAWTDDMLGIKMTLRDNVLFHNGTKLTAEDVAYSLGATVNAMIAEAYDRCEIEDDLHLTLWLKAVNVDFLYYLTQSAAMIECKSAVEEDPMNTRIGTGPWKVTSLIEGDSVELERNMDYWGEIPVTETVSLRTISDASARLVALQNDEVQFITRPSNDELPFAAEDENLVIYQYPTSTVTYFVMNCAKGPFTDKNLRLACAYALDRTKHSLVLGDTSAIPAYTFMGPNLMEWQVKPEEFETNMDTDLEKAREYAALCGDNNTFTLYCNDQPLYQLPAQVFQASLKEIGITCNIVEFDSAGISSKMVWDGEYDMLYQSHDFRDWPSSNVGSFLDENDLNLSHVADERILELIALAAATDDVATRKQYYAEIQKINHDEVYYLTVDCPSATVIYRKGTSGFEIIANGAHDYSYICVVDE